MDKKETIKDYEFVSEEAEKEYFDGMDRIVWLKDNLGDLTHFLQYDTMFNGNDLRTCYDKIDVIGDELDNLFDALNDAYKKKGLMVKKKELRDNSF